MTKASGTRRKSSPAPLIIRDAELSSCGKYRYWLSRCWGDPDKLANRLTWLMLNPSIADHEKDDATIRKCMGFARVYGYTGVVVVNLFSIRETHPKNLAQLPEASLVGPEDMYHLQSVLWNATVVCAWGQHQVLRRQIRHRVSAIKHLLPQKTWCLGYCADGSPRHPLMPAYSTELEVWHG